MAGKNHNLPKRLVQGKTAKSQEAQVPSAASEGGINTSFQDIKWTPKKLALVLTILLAPFTFAIVISFKSGNSLIGIPFTWYSGLCWADVFRFTLHRAK